MNEINERNLAQPVFSREGVVVMGGRRALGEPLSIVSY
jgi:hypothetical protein